MISNSALRFVFACICITGILAQEFTRFLKFPGFKCDQTAGTLINEPQAGKCVVKGLMNQCWAIETSPTCRCCQTAKAADNSTFLYSPANRKAEEQCLNDSQCEPPLACVNGTCGCPVGTILNATRNGCRGCQDDNWHFYEHFGTPKCYRFSTTARTWSDAELECESDLGGSHLASVHSLEEFNFIGKVSTDILKGIGKIFLITKSSTPTRKPSIASSLDFAQGSNFKMLGFVRKVPGFREQILGALLASINGLLQGFLIGYSPVFLDLFSKDPDAPFVLSDVQAGFFSSMFPMGTTIGYILSGSITARFGRLEDIFFQESPMWLLMKGREEEAKESLAWYRGSPVAGSEEEAAMMSEFQEFQQQIKDNYSRNQEKGLQQYKLLLDSRFRRSFFIVCVVLLGRTLNGVYAITAFQTQIFEESSAEGSRPPIPPRLSTIVIGITQLLFCLLSSTLADRLGRKLSTVLSMAIMFFTMVFFGVSRFCSIKGIGPFDGEISAWITIFCVFLYTACFSFGIGPGAFTLAGEILPVQIKNQAIGIGTALNGSGSFLTISSFFPLRDALTEAGLYWLYAAVCLAIAMICATTLKETRGKSLADIERMMSSKKSLVANASQASLQFPTAQSQVQQKKASEDDVDTHIQNRYELDRRLGKGAYGVVYRALDHLTGNVVAVKKIYDAFRNGTDAQRTLREISFLCIFSGHPNIVHLINVHEAANPRDLYLIFEYVSYDLDSLIKRRKFKLREKQFILYQIFNGIAFMHSAGVMHRDLKPSNILVDDAFEVKLCDLGLARAVSDRIRAGCETPQGQGLTDYVATRWYRAPEILLGSNRYTKSVDMWSIGCILAEMLTQEPMFQGRTAFHQLDLILSIVPHPTREDLRHLESHLRINAIENTMGRVRRRTWAEVIPDSTPEEREMLSCLLQFSYRKRLTAVEALQHPYLGPFRNSHEIQLLSRKSTICQMVDKRHALLRDGNLLQPENYRKIIMEMIKSFPQCGIPRRTSSFMSESVSRLSLMSRVSSSPTRVGLDILERSGMDTRPKASHPSTSIFAHKATSFQATTDNVLGRSESYHCSRQQSIASVHELNRFRRPVPESQHLTHGRMDRASKASNLALNRNTANARPMYIRREVSSPSCSSNSFQKPIRSQILNYSRHINNKRRRERQRTNTPARKATVAESCIATEPRWKTFVPHPTREDLRHLESHLRINAIENTMGRVRRRTWAEVIPDSTPEEREMLSCLLQFSYRKRLTAVEALQHPYLGPFRNSHEIQLLSRKSTICQMVDKRHALLRDGNLLQPENYRKIIMEMIKSFPQCGIPRRTSSFMSESVSRLSLMSRVSSSPTRVGLDILERSGMDTRPKASHPSTSIFAHKATSFQATTDNVLGRSESYHCSRQQSIASVHELNRFRRRVPESQHLTHGRDRASKGSNLALNRDTANARPMYIRREVSSPSCSSNSFQQPIRSQILNYSRHGGSSSYESLSEHNSGRNARLSFACMDLCVVVVLFLPFRCVFVRSFLPLPSAQDVAMARGDLLAPTGRQHPSGQAGIFESTKSSLNLPTSFPLFTRCPPGFKLKAAVSPASSFQNPKTAATSSMAAVPSTAHRSKPTRSTTNTVVAVIGRAGLTSAKRGPAKSPVKRIVIPIDNRRQTNVQRRALEFESKNTHARQFRIKQSPKYRCVSPTWRTNEPEEIILAPARSEHCVIDVGNEDKNPLKVSRIRRRGGRDDNRHLERQEDDDNDSLLVTATLSALSLAATASG
ncbi:unnamed protein product, partial [Cyprideis torosa]